MIHFFVVADSDHEGALNWASTVEHRLKGAISHSLVEFRNLTDIEHQYHLFVLPKKNLGTRRQADIVNAFDNIAEALRKIIDGANLSSDRFIGVLDVRVGSSAHIKNIQSLQSVQGLLILAFPEVLWIPEFAGQDVFAPSVSEGGLTVSDAIALVRGGFTPLFDGTGLRSTLIQERGTTAAESRYIRKDVALAIDEEQHFAFINAYTAYRFGYRACPIGRNSVARSILSGGRARLPSIAGCAPKNDFTLVVFEDGFIEFPDVEHKGNSEHDLGERRDGRWPLLTESNLRVLTTMSGPDEKIASIGDNSVNIRTSFSRGRVRFRDLHVSGMSRMSVSLARTERCLFNLCAGWMRGVWLWNICSSILIVGMLSAVLFKFPVFFVPAVFLVFVVVGVMRRIAGYFVSTLGVGAKWLQAFVKIRSQWRFFPKLFVNHCPQNQIHQKGTHYWCLVQKPIDGIFGLRNQCGLPNGRGYGGLLSSKEVRSVYSNTLYSRVSTETGRELQEPSHAAPGMVLEVATHLIKRAREMKGMSLDVEGAIHAAVLATSAYELLNHKTPALSIEALSLRHYFEVWAECEFPGVRAKLDMEDRYIDIHNSMWQICRSSSGIVRESHFESGMASICDELVELLRSHEKFEEAAFFSRKSRHMHRLLLSPFMRNLLAFPEWAVRSKINFFTSLTIFLGVFAIYYKFNIDQGADITGVLSKMYELLFSTQPNMDLTEIMTGTNASSVNATLKLSEASQLVVKIEPTSNIQEKIASATVVVQAMRQLALIHIGFLAALFYDFMHRK